MSSHHTSSSPVITRFAPSPTGYLHIGGARTAYFNWLFAKHHQGKFLLRIEDTDVKRSTQEAVDAIYDSMTWLGLTWDGDAMSQIQNKNRHQEVAHQMLANDKAYKCYCTVEELDAMRQEQKEKNLPQKYDGRCRHKREPDVKAGTPSVVRLKAPAEGETILEDEVQGRIVVQNSQLDDMVLLRSDGTPTYMLSVVVDDHDMGITHVIRGDDHLTNTFRQIQIYQSMGWTIPSFSHIPLIHGPDGAKLSKRHGALGAETYRELGYLPEAMKNYLLRLGWSHGDDEIISTEQATEWFTLKNIGKSPSRFDIEKLNNLNHHYIGQCETQRLLSLSTIFLEKALGQKPSDEQMKLFEKALPLLKERAKTLVDLATMSVFLLQDKVTEYSEKAQQHLTHPDAQPLLSKLHDHFESIPESDWTAATAENSLKEFMQIHHLKMGQVGPLLRSALTGIMESPPLFPVIEILGRQKTLWRLRNTL